MAKLFRKYNITYYTEPISYPFLTGLIKKAVQAIQFFLKTKYLKRKKPETWSLDIRNGILFINIKTIRIYKYLLSELMLGFKPKLMHFNTNMAPLLNHPEVLKSKFSAY